MLRRKLTLAFCSTGILFSTAVWVALLAQPAQATNCNGSCGPDTGSCTGAHGNCPSGGAGQCTSSCSGSYRSYANVVAQGTSNTPGVRTTGNIFCFTTWTCAFVTVANKECHGFFVPTCDPVVGPTCRNCGLTSVNSNYFNCTYVGPCTEG